MVRSFDALTFYELLAEAGWLRLISLSESSFKELAELRAAREKSKARAKHASTRRWKLDEGGRAARDDELRSSFQQIKRANPSLSARRAGHFVGKSRGVSEATVLRAAGLKRRRTNFKSESPTIG